MNRIAFLWTLTTLIFISCENKQMIETVQEETKVMNFSATRSSKVQLGDVKTFIQERYCNQQTKTAMEYQIVPIVHTNDTIMYIVNYHDGWEVISGDRRTEPILFYCATGNITEEGLYMNPAQTDVLNELSEYLDSLVANPIEMEEGIPTKSNPTPPMSYVDSDGRLWVYAYRTRISNTTLTQQPLTGLRWGQGSKYHSSYPTKKWNIVMPYDSPSKVHHCYAGCSPVACAQVLVYLHGKYGIPANMYKTGSTTAYLANSSSWVTLNVFNSSFSNYGNHWSILPSSGLSATDDQFRAASALLLHIGRKADASYAYTGTAAGLQDLASALSYYGYSSTFISHYSDIFYDQIYTKKLPIIARIEGQTTEGTVVSDFDHAIVFEGVERNREVYRYYYKNGDSGTFEYQTRTYTFNYDSVAVNWGYDGDGEYNSSGSVIWNNVSSMMTRIYATGSNTGTITEMLYNFQLN